jgi:hypothetical protein
MSCAFLNSGEACDRPAGPGTSSFDSPYTVLANGLHAMAQPLTVLRGALGAWKMRNPIAAESDRYIEMSAKQIDRLGDLLLCMQEVLDTADGETKHAKVDLGELIGIVLEDMNSVHREWGGAIDIAKPAVPVYILGDADRTERAIRSAIKVTILLSPLMGVIRLSVRSNEGQVEVRAEQTAKHGKNLGFVERLYLSLVETNIRSQGGSFKCIEDPLSILFTLPAYSPAHSFEPIERMPCPDGSCILPVDVGQHETGFS